ncbi:guanine nucleotide binding protein, alpha subunit [Coprinopsis sp. MPI-PUGE-AT-0042]|nr:guanine nucleotide binding protein, alpha subunit [Coprinopsis sp. MPI-PUGE-AT-0042]
MISTRKSGPSFTWPPPPPSNETEEQKKERARQEVIAKERNDEIDRLLNAEKERRKKPKAKILLLGQAESGKSTVLKNFQLQFAPKAFENDTLVWRPVIHLNLVRSVNFILNLLQSSQPSDADEQQASAEHRKLAARLAPLRQVEATLCKALSGSSSTSPLNLSPLKASAMEYPSGYSWKKAITGRRSGSSGSAGLVGATSEFGQAARILAACGEDIVRLWEDLTVRNLLRAADIALEEQPGFFLDQAQRITDEDYRPQPEDVLKARVSTIGPEEHVIVPENPSDASAKEWVIYDVGGSRSQRAAWAQFFDDMNIIIFLAPMSGFNQVLAEDERVNRLTDSLRLWQTLCSNKLLMNVEFVIFLNKLDILDAKLKSGIQFSQFVTSYVDKPNETKPVAKYLLDVFVSLHQQLSPKKRHLHPHLTCAVDTKATSIVIIRVKEVILLKLLAQTNVL